MDGDDEQFFFETYDPVAAADPSPAADDPYESSFQESSFVVDTIKKPYVPGVDPPLVAAGGGGMTPADLTSLYLATFGRPPDANELASDLDNARRYGDAGVVRGIQLRAGNAPGSGVRGDEYLAPLSTQDQVVNSMTNASVGTEGWRDILGGIVGMIPVPGAPQLGDIIAGGGLVPQLPMPRRPVPQLPAPGRTPPIIDIPIPSRGGIISRGGRAAAIAAAAAAAGLSIAEYVALHPELRRHRHMNVLNARALRRAFSRVDGFGKFVRRTIHLEKHAPRPKKKQRRK